MAKRDSLPQEQSDHQKDLNALSQPLTDDGNKRQRLAENIANESEPTDGNELNSAAAETATSERLASESSEADLVNQGSTESNIILSSHDVANAVATPQNMETSSMQSVKGMGGRIEYLEVINFMCHEYLKVPFGPKINFVIGRNGSGKSAILTGLMICLGGKATLTSRATNLKDFILHGKDAARVTVSIYNGGDDPFKYESYGDEILVERRINRDGTSSYRIKSKQDKTVSTKREELLAMMDHYNIQIDNPVTILSQDTSRQFLNNSSPGDKYKFFARGTELEQMNQDYLQVQQRSDELERTLATKKTILPELKKKREELARKMEELERAQEQEKLLAARKVELAWSFVTEKEKELESLNKEASKIEKNHRRALDAMEKLQAEYDTNGKKLEELVEQERSVRAHRADLIREKQQINANSVQPRNLIGRLESEIGAATAKISVTGKNIEMTEQQILQERQRLETDTKERKEAQLRRIHELETEIQDILEKYSKTKLERDSIEEKRAKLVAQSADGQNQLQFCERRIHELQSNIKLFEKTKEDKLHLFGRATANIVADIRKETRFAQRPLGPLGMHIRLKDQKWNVALESAIGAVADNFIVSSVQDQRLLRGIIDHHRGRHGIVILGEMESYRHLMEPPPQYLTILRAIECDSPWVMNALIVHYKIEQLLLIEQEAEARRLIFAGVVENVEKYFTMSGSTLVNRNGAISFSAFTPDPNKSKIFENIDVQIHRTKEELEEKNKEFKKLNSTQGELYRNQEEFISQLRKIRDMLQTQQTQSNVLKESLEEAKIQMREDDNVKLFALESDCSKLKENMSLLQRQLDDLVQQKQHTENSLRPFDVRLTELSQEEKKYDTIAQQTTNLMDELEKTQTNALATLNAIRRKAQEHESDLKKGQVFIDEVENEIKNQTGKAREYHEERVPVTHSSLTLQKEIAILTKSIEERNRNQGTLESITREFKNSEKEYQDTKKMIRQSESELLKIRELLQERSEKWAKFRKYIVLRTKNNFVYYLSLRNYNGKISFDHEKETLDIKVQIDLKDGHFTGSKDYVSKDTKSLSGGERSFSTIAFLLALWEAIECPFRCLDEFDVFMDAVNRRLAMKMLIDAARNGRNQYILITPQDMSNVSFGPDVCVYRLKDPRNDSDVVSG